MEFGGVGGSLAAGFTKMSVGEALLASGKFAHAKSGRGDGGVLASVRRKGKKGGNGGGGPTRCGHTAGMEKGSPGGICGGGGTGRRRQDEGAMEVVGGRLSRGRVWVKGGIRPEEEKRHVGQPLWVWSDEQCHFLIKLIFKRIRICNGPNIAFLNSKFLNKIWL
jgi:hypothetical protein